ncbi:MAG TPA: alpha-hydroxy acid oxidase [Ilumatobacter sp.]|nr:alpha-hydroxy acid oxidase [Ilumatobacter sp.]
MRVWDTFRSVVRFRKFETDPVARRLRTALTVDDMRRIAKRRLPHGVFDYIDGGAEDERAMVNNSAAFGRIEFCPNVLRDVSEIDVSTTLLGRPISMPLVLAPTGYTRLTHSQGELSVARAAERAGIPYSLSTMSTRSIEEVAAVSNGPKWFQVYTWKDRGLVREMVERAAAAGYEAIILTVDTAVLGRRERDARRGFSIPPRIGPGTIIDGIVHPAWTYDFITHEPLTFANVSHLPEYVSDGDMGRGQYVMMNFDQKLGWSDVEWLQSVWSGPIVLKGIQTVDDAKRAVAAGVRGIALSNHGGRQLDDAPAPIDLVEPVAQAVQGEAEIICDGGVRRGSDVVKAIALGATACSIGRPYLFAMGAAGERGVDQLLGMFREGIARTMALSGRTTIDEIDRCLVRWR